MRLYAGIGLLLAVCLSGCQESAEYREYESPNAFKEMQVGDGTLTIEVADTFDLRTQGLMHRKVLPADRGMLFAYPEARVIDFWMKNTFIPLSIAFFNDDGVVVNIENMQPLVERPSTSSLGKVRFALEVNQGWFKKHGIKAGDRIELPEWVTKIDAEKDPEV